MIRSWFKLMIVALVVTPAWWAAAWQVLGQPPAQKLPKGASKLLPDIEYARVGGKQLRFDLYFPEQTETPMPLIIHVHGGGWSAGTFKSFPKQPFLSAGYALASVQYRLSGEATFPATIQDVKAAVRWLRANAAKYKLDPDRFGAWGPSAGGHLVALLGTSGGAKEFEVGENLDISSKVQAVCDWFGPTDFLTIGEQLAKAGYKFDHDSATSPIGRLIGGPVQQNKEKCKQASPLTYITKDAPPFLILHGDKDSLVPVAQSRELEAALNKVGVEVNLLVLPGAGHGGEQFIDNPAQTKMLEFFDKHLKKKSK
jgi:acetyl esterase/lipase